MRRLDPTIVKQQIGNLLAAYPELQEDDVLRLDMIEGETEAFEFLRAVEQRRQEAASLAGAIAGNIAELGLRQERFERREKAMRALAFKVLEAADLPKVELPEATLSIRAGQSKVIITDEAVIPDVLCKITRAPDKARIKELLKQGQSVRGAELSNTEPTLSIRVK